MVVGHGNTVDPAEYRMDLSLKTAEVVCNIDWEMCGSTRVATKVTLASVVKVACEGRSGPSVEVGRSVR